MKLKGVYDSEVFGVRCTLVVAPSTPFKHKDKFVKELKKHPTIDLTIDEIRGMIKEIGNDLIVLGGLEWGDSPSQMMELVSASKEDGLRFIFQTCYSTDDFQERVGRACFDMIGMSEEEKEKLTNEDDPEVYKFVGYGIMDYYIDNDYIIVESPHKNREGEVVNLFRRSTDEDYKN